MTIEQGVFVSVQEQFVPLLSEQLHPLTFALSPAPVPPVTFASCSASSNSPEFIILLNNEFIY